MKVKSAFWVFSLSFLFACSEEVQLSEPLPVMDDLDDSSDSSLLDPDYAERIVGGIFEGQIPLQPLSRAEVSDVDCFVLNVGAGNCVFLRGPCGVVVVDAGTLIPGYQFNQANQKTLEERWCDFCSRNENILDIFSGIGQVTFIATHLDVDHCVFIPYLVRHAIALNNGKININFCIGAKIGEAQNFLKACYAACGGVSYNVFVQEPLGSLVGNTLPFWRHVQSDDPVSFSKIEEILANTLGSHLAHFHVLVPVSGLVHPEDRNSQSLVLLFEHFGSTILFTGDATKDTLEAILGDRDSVTREDDRSAIEWFLNEYTEGAVDRLQVDRLQIVISAVSKRNRRLLKHVNLIMESHHGSEDEGCNLWVPKIIELSCDNFCGCLSSSDPFGTYGHPRHATVNFVKFPQSAMGFLKDVLSCTVAASGSAVDRLVYKTAKTKKNIFQTIFVAAYQILFRNTGMSIYCQDREQQELTKHGGFSLYTQHFWDYFLIGGDIAFHTLNGAIQANNSLLRLYTAFECSPLSLQVEMLPLRHKCAFLENVDAFLRMFKLDPGLVFGRFQDILNLNGSSSEIRIEDVFVSKSRLMPLVRKEEIGIPRRQVYMGNQGIHTWDQHFLDDPDTIERLYQAVHNALGNGAKLPSVSVENIYELMLSVDKATMTDYIVATLANHLDVLQTTIDFLRCTDLQGSDLFELLVHTLNTYKGYNHAEHSTEERLSNYDILMRLNIDGVVTEHFEEIVFNTVILLFMNIDNTTDVISAQLKQLVGIISLLTAVEKNFDPVLQVLLDNVLMGGWCAPGYRNRLYDILASFWESYGGAL
ncbi:MAG: hypothetical protein LBJ89_01545 [Holosporales bacterium]|jgi:hypothetical protein|nr:hypothetical protein [Holosporales bacterium]